MVFDILVSFHSSLYIQMTNYLYNIYVCKNKQTRQKKEVNLLFSELDFNLSLSFGA